MIGAVALCLLAAVVVPLLLESEPTRSVSDVSLVMPSRDTPLPAPAAAEAASAAAVNPAQVNAAAEAKAADAKAADAKATEAKAAEAKAAEAKATEAKAAAAKAADAKAADAKAGQARAADARSGASKSTESKSATGKSPDAKSADARSADAKSADAKSADAKSADAKSADAKSARPDARANRPDEIALLAETAQARARGETVGRYVLQVGAFSGEGGAAVAVDRVQALGLPAFTQRIRTDRGERFRVRVGPFVSRESAEQARLKLKAAGVDAALIAP